MMKPDRARRDVDATPFFKQSIVESSIEIKGLSEPGWAMPVTNGREIRFIRRIRG
jgi:hypothetical protein